jgi:uncharacterized integral membrane protein
VVVTILSQYNTMSLSFALDFPSAQSLCGHMNLKLIIILLLIALGAIFIVQNVDVVELRFLFWTMSMSRALMFVFLLLIGIVIGWLLHGHMSRTKLHNK